MITDPILLQRNLQDDVNFCSLCDRKASVRGNAEVTLIGFDMILLWNTWGATGLEIAMFPEAMISFYEVSELYRLNLFMTCIPYTVYQPEFRHMKT